MATRTRSYRPAIITVVAAFILVVILPSSWKESWAPAFLRPGFHLGLDLAGGTQLDFRISEDEIQAELAALDTQIEEASRQGASAEKMAELQTQRQAVEDQRTNLMEAIRTVLERRINALGVSEATITPSYFGNERHLLVECPGVIDVQECIDTVGKTIQLEFKEEYTEATDDYAASVRATAQAALERVQSGTALSAVGQDLDDDLGIAYVEEAHYFRDQLPPGLDSLWGASPEQEAVLLEGSVPSTVQGANGAVEQQNIPGLFLAKVLAPRTMTGRVIAEAREAFAILAAEDENRTARTQEDVELTSVGGSLSGVLRTADPGTLAIAQDGSGASLIFLRQFTAGREEVDVSHILIAYQGANAADASITRTKEEALERANALRTRVENGESFEDIARVESDGPSKESGGALGSIGRGDLVPSFEAVAFTQEPGVLSQPVETPFGYHIIRVNSAPIRTADRASFDEISIRGTDASATAEALKARLEAGEVTRQEEIATIRSVFFSLQPTGWKDTALDGSHFRSASVLLDPQTNQPNVQILFDEEGAELFRELTGRNVGKRIAIFVGGQLVSAPTVNSEIAGGTAVITGSQNISEAQMLAQDLNTGAIPAPIHLSGQRTVEPTLGAASLRMSVWAGVIGLLVVMLYMIAFYRLLGVVASLALLAYSAIFLAILKLPILLLTDQYIVLTLAGAAGVILSVGMAVDTNVLVFERVKEELRRGKTLRAAIDIGFSKAWPSIRDSNISTMITCVILFAVGTSIVRGFAITLGMGVIISMFSGLILSRWLAHAIARSNLRQSAALFPGMRTDATRE